MNQQNQRPRALTNWLLIIAVVLLAAIPLVLNRNAEFGGSDDAASDAISEIDPGYQPWFQPLWEPPSGEIESLLFALQAGLGAGVIGYVLGLKRGAQQAQAAAGEDKAAAEPRGARLSHS